MSTPIKYIAFEIPVGDREEAKEICNYIYDQLAGTNDLRRQDIVIEFRPPDTVVIMLFNRFMENHTIQLDIFRRGI